MHQRLRSGRGALYASLTREVRMRKSLWVVLVLALASCGGPQRGRELDVTPLGQARAVELLEEVVQSRPEYGAPTVNVAARLNNGTAVTVDVMVPGLDAGFVWLNEQDRRDTSGEIPPPAEASQLYALLAQLIDGGRQIHVLIVQDTDFTYIPNPRANERLPEDRTIDDVEARLRRDALDFLHAIADLRGGQTGS
jgi:hypothetical protein